MNITKEMCFSISMDDRQGCTADLLNACKTANCSLQGIWGWGMEGKAEFMVVPENAEEFKKACEAAGMDCKETACIRMQGANGCGVACDATNMLAEAGISMCAFEGQGCGDNASCFMWFEDGDMAKACEVLGCSSSGASPSACC